MDDNRRAFLKNLAGRSLAAAGVAIVAADLSREQPRLKRIWKDAKPLVKSFAPSTTVYAQSTGAGSFTLKGTT
jgi:hypothetical protein